MGGLAGAVAARGWASGFCSGAGVDAAATGAVPDDAAAPGALSSAGAAAPLAGETVAGAPVAPLGTIPAGAGTTARTAPGGATGLALGAPAPRVMAVSPSTEPFDAVVVTALVSAAGFSPVHAAAITRSDAASVRQEVF